VATYMALWTGDTRDAPRACSKTHSVDWGFRLCRATPFPLATGSGLRSTLCQPQSRTRPSAPSEPRLGAPRSTAVSMVCCRIQAPNPPVGESCDPKSNNSTISQVTLVKRLLFGECTRLDKLTCSLETGTRALPIAVDLPITAEPYCESGEFDKFVISHFSSPRRCEE
jgi:hypothetical protein